MRERIRDGDWRLPAALLFALGVVMTAILFWVRALREAIRRGDTIWLPDLPQPFSWTLTLSVTGDVPVHVCSRD